MGIKSASVDTTKAKLVLRKSVSRQCLGQIPSPVCSCTFVANNHFALFGDVPHKMILDSNVSDPSETLKFLGPSNYPWVVLVWHRHSVFGIPSFCSVNPAPLDFSYGWR